MTLFRPVLSGLIRLTDALNALARFICCGLIAVIVCTTVMQVALRYLINRPTQWSEEAAMFCLVWFGMLAVAIGGRHDWHVAITWLRDRLPPLGAKLLDRIALLSVFGFGMILVLNSAQLVAITGSSVLPASSIPKSLLYYSIMAGGGLMALNAVVALFVGFPPEEISEEEQLVNDAITNLQEASA